MKKLITILMIVLILPVAFAQESETTPGVTPDWGFIYSLDKFFDEAKVKSAESNFEKAQLRIQIAEERAMEMEAMHKKGKSTEANLAQLEYQKNIEDVDLITDEMEDDDEKNKIQDKLQNHIMVLERVREMAPVQAQEGLNNAIQNSNKVMEVNNIKVSYNNRRSLTQIKNSGTIIIPEDAVVTEESDIEQYRGGN